MCAMVMSTHLFPLCGPDPPRLFRITKVLFPGPRWVQRPARWPQVRTVFFSLHRTGALLFFLFNWLGEEASSCDVNKENESLPKVKAAVRRAAELLRRLFRGAGGSPCGRWGLWNRRRKQLVQKGRRNRHSQTQRSGFRTALQLRPALQTLVSLSLLSLSVRAPMTRQCDDSEMKLATAEPSSPPGLGPRQFL